MMTKQEVFDTVARHLLTQRRRSVDNYGLCLYRSPDGCKCAAGAILPDDLYTEEMESRSVVADEVTDKFSAVVEFEALGLLASLQRLHDKGGNWTEGLRGKAHLHGLSSAVVDEYPECFVTLVKEF